ncbi:patatin-like phospholipase family protein [Aquibacillus koreensis]|uniref:Patatin-like phospholipase family protein n=1 Tax=Aquibacillus koreensis TaxID=279446 RepID=A0A9X3WI91_9BACI|nr:patatin-like phospholipase family protein [Aquibacillus koreensis]MCT2537534.1 patatin-like phospholipase family protein [Aquibacillus koreensis]MDC3418980.1 patatin-like phospholipase family protein [Aquibacillus koreensis]
MNIDGVFSGGGVKAFAFIGALQKLEEHNYSFVRVAGTSSGAIIAGLLSAGYKANEIEELFNDLNLKEFLDTTKIGKYLPFIKWFRLYFTMGLYKGAAFEKWLYQVLAEKGVYTFNDLPKGSLKVIASDITLGRMIVIPDDLESLYGINGSAFPVSTAIRMSASLPYFFIPVTFKNKKYKKSVIVDGGLLSNLPIWVFDQQRGSQKRPIIGMKLSETISRLPSKDVSNALDMVEALITTMMKAHDARYIRKNKIKDILFLPVKDVDLSNLKLSNEKKNELIELGKNHTTTFLKHWP